MGTFSQFGTRPPAAIGATEAWEQEAEAIAQQETAPARKRIAWGIIALVVGFGAAIYFTVKK